MKVERVSYDVPTPSAARAIFDAILWKPAIRWVVRKIEVLTPIQWISVRRNEVAKIMSNRSGIFIENERCQRASLFFGTLNIDFMRNFFLFPRRSERESSIRFPIDLLTLKKLKLLKFQKSKRRKRSEIRGNV